jgi:hypothetical protein
LAIRQLWICEILLEIIHYKEFLFYLKISMSVFETRFPIVFYVHQNEKMRIYIEWSNVIAWKSFLSQHSAKNTFSYRKRYIIHTANLYRRLLNKLNVQSSVLLCLLYWRTEETAHFINFNTPFGKRSITCLTSMNYVYL